MEKQRNIPDLRFPEFDGEWKLQRLGDVTEIYDGTHQTPNYVKDGIPFYSVEQVTANDFTNTKFVTSEVYEGEQKRVVIEMGDILMTRIGDIGTPRYIDWDVRASFYVSLALIKQSNKYCSEFFSQYIRTKTFQKELWNRTIHVAFPIKINLGEIGNCKASFPSIPEQQKIASFFTTIDHKISQLKQKKTLLEQYKKGVMQKIFSQGIRFKEDNGKEFPKWENYKFKQIYNFKVTNSFSRENLNYECGIVKNIHYGDIHTKFATLFDITKEEVPYINSDISIERISDGNYCKKGDIVFADASEDVIDVGKSIELVNLNGEKVLAGLHTILARPDISKVASGFGGYFMKSEDVRKQIMKISQGSKVTSISSTRLCDIELNIPCLAEQTKIAGFLSAIDDKINHTHTQIEKAELWKKGLLQKMFV
ncbi:MAG: restriction endonuclease subunit S [Bacteroidales bacterium]